MSKFFVSDEFSFFLYWFGFGIGGVLVVLWVNYFELNVNIVLLFSYNVLVVLEEFSEKKEVELSFVKGKGKGKFKEFKIKEVKGIKFVKIIKVVFDIFLFIVVVVIELKMSVVFKVKFFLFFNLVIIVGIFRFNGGEECWDVKFNDFVLLDIGCFK